MLYKLLACLLLLQIGFRHTCVSAGQLLHNNRPLLLRGVNRHEWHERWGGCDSSKQQRLCCHGFLPKLAAEPHSWRPTSIARPQSMPLCCASPSPCVAAASVCPHLRGQTHLSPMS